MAIASFVVFNDISAAYRMSRIVRSHSSMPFVLLFTAPKPFKCSAAGVSSETLASVSSR